MYQKYNERTLIFKTKMKCVYQKICKLVFDNVELKIIERDYLIFTQTSVVFPADSLIGLMSL